jgi:hypothetical protein
VSVRLEGWGGRVPLMLRDASQRSRAVQPFVLASHASRVYPTCAFSSARSRVNPRSGAMLLSMRVRAWRAGDPAAQRAAPTEAALILPAWVSSCGAVLLRRSIPSRLRSPVPPEARSWPFPARLGGGVAIWSRRPNASTLARTRGILWGMRPWRALRGGQAGARPVSQPPAPACAPLPVIKVKISRWRPLR